MAVQANTLGRAKSMGSSAAEEGCGKFVALLALSLLLF